VSTVEIGSEFAGHTIEAEAGRGGMGVVYRARDVALDRLVALKVITPNLAEDDDFRQRFKRESRVAAGIRHPHVIAIHRAGEEHGVLFITMDFVHGTDLKEALTERGRLPPIEAAQIVSQVGTALDAAHAIGLVHRDIKPANVLLESNGETPHAYLTDFGLTKHASSESGMTETGMFVGTMDYIAPEQVQGARLDARADVYSLGCVLFQSLTGSVPYPRDSEVAKLWAHVGEPPPSVLQSAPEVPAGFEEVVARAMAKEPADRYPSAGDLGRAALAVAEARAVTPQERSVATGDAAFAQGPAPAPAPAPAAPSPEYTHPASEYTPPPPQYTPPQPTPYSPVPSPPAPQPATPPAGYSRGRLAHPHASWGARGAAMLIDWVAVAILSIVIAAPATAASEDVFAIVWIFVGAPLAVFLWSVLPMARKGRGNGQSAGKQLIGLRVVPEEGERLTLARAAFRELVLKLLVFGFIGVWLVLPPILDYLWPLWNENDKALHDLLGRTSVVNG